MSTRRALLQAGAASVASLVVGFRVEAATPPATPATSPSAPFQPNAWLRLDADGAVHLVLTKTELGQGATTGIAMVMADELDADWARVHVEIQVPDGKRSMGTGGSTSLQATWKPARVAAAQAREALKAAAAATWGVPTGECRTASHAVEHAPSGRRLGYGELAGRAAGQPLPKDPPLKPAA
ncbi:MAG TPA: molybdopterin cofactor-binding domain-containing protein, partial [Ideonella sp.]|nr:molybdopterin cofactor-binding domain-containing protein [Ideonella sp.]